MLCGGAWYALKMSQKRFLANMTIPIPSQKFLLFWLIFISGLVIGKYSNFPLLILGWLTGLWGLLWWSKQEEWVELLALGATAAGAGMIVWQLTGGETWLHLNFLSQLSTWLETLRNSIGERIFAVLPEPHGSLLGGIIFGNKVQLDKDLVDAFRVVGLTHIIAVSGYNLTILSKNAETLLRGWLGRKAMWVSLGLILFFVIITGAPASILRAAVMATTIIWARMFSEFADFGRRRASNFRAKNRFQHRLSTFGCGHLRLGTFGADNKYPPFALTDTQCDQLNFGRNAGCNTANRAVDCGLLRTIIDRITAHKHSSSAPNPALDGTRNNWDYSAFQLAASGEVSDIYLLADSAVDY